jgi:RNA polymerase sigma-70 factor (ECF subfamily)
MTDSIPENTVDLLLKLKAGDLEARNKLVERAVPSLRRWARGRLPQWARSLGDTQDLVQDVVLRALPRLSSFEPRGQGALQAFLRCSLRNQIVDEVRKARLRQRDDSATEQTDPGPSPLEQVVKREGLEKYRRALESLDGQEQDVIRARVERQQSYTEIAKTLGKRTPDAARMAVNRAIAKLVTAMASSR